MDGTGDYLVSECTETVIAYVQLYAQSRFKYRWGPVTERNLSRAGEKETRIREKERQNVPYFSFTWNLCLVIYTYSYMA